MLVALLFLAPLPPAYQATLICKVPAKYFQSYVRCSVLTEQNLVAGFTCTSTGHHGETFMGKPFVWSKGKFVKLPLLPKAEYGHVYGGNDKVILGSVTIDYRPRPVKWGPDPKLGWHKPVVTQLSTKEGFAANIGPDGAIWVVNDIAVVGKVSKGVWSDLSFGNFDLKGFDAKGNIYGNKWVAVHFGGKPADTTPGWFSGKTWNTMPIKKTGPEYGMDSRIESVNASGDAVGNCQNQFAIWQGGKVTLPLAGKYRWSFASDISSSGVALGYASVPDIQKSMAFLWENGKVTNLSNVVPGIELEMGHKVNSRGSVAVSGHVKNEAHLYLLTPKP